MKTKHSHKKSRFVPRHKRRGVLPHGVVRLGGERLEPRSLMASDLPFTNPVEHCDVNNDGLVNRSDVFAIVGELRSGGERSLGVVSSMAEGEAAPSSSMYLDVNGDNYFDRRDAFSLIAHLRAEGEQNPTARELMEFDLRIFSADGKTEFFDQDGAGPLGVPIALNSDFLVRLFVKDSRTNADGTPIANAGMGQFALDLEYGQGVALVRPDPTIPPAPPNPELAGTRFEGIDPAHTGANGRQFAFPNNVFVDPTYNQSTQFPGRVDDSISTVRDIQGLINFNLALNPQGGDFVMALEIPFHADIQTGSFSFFTEDFSSRGIDPRFFNAHQFPSGLPEELLFLNSSVDDDEVRIDIVATPFAVPDFVTRFEQDTITPINIPVLANDIVDAGSTKTLSLSTDPALMQQPTFGTVRILTNDVADPNDDSIEYTLLAANRFFVGIETFQYAMTDSNGATDLGDVLIDFREFNFDPIATADPGVAPSVQQGEVIVILASDVLPNDNGGDLADTTIPGPPNPEPNPQTVIISNRNEVRDNNGVQQVVDTRPTVREGAAAGTVTVDGAGNLRFVANPRFVGVAHIDYFIEDNGFEQRLLPPAPLTAAAAALFPKFAPNSVAVTVTELPDIAAFRVEFFDATGVNPLVGNEVDVNTDFITRVFVTYLGSPENSGIASAALDLQYKDKNSNPVTNVHGDTGVVVITPSNFLNIIDSTDPASSFTIVPPTAANLSPANPGFIDDVRGNATARLPHPDLARNGFFDIQMHSGGVASTGQRIEFLPAFSAGVTIFGRGLALSEAEISFFGNELTVAAGERPVAVNDGPYVVQEDGTIDLTDPGRRTGSNIPPVAFDPTKGVLNNDTDPDADPPISDPLNLLRAFIEPGFGPLHAQQFTLREDGTFLYVPVANYNGPDSFRYRAKDQNDRVSELTALVTIQVNAVNDIPVARNDVYTVDIRNGAGDPPLTIADAGRIDGTGTDTGLVQTKGVLDNDSDNDAPVAGFKAVPNFANLANFTHFGTLVLHRKGAPQGDFTGANGFVLFTSATTAAALPAGFDWDGAFQYTADVGVRGVTDTFEYFANDGTVDSTLAATVKLEVGLTDIAVGGLVYIDNNRNGVFDFEDTNGSGAFDYGDISERTLGGVKVQISGTEASTGNQVTFEATTNAAGVFAFPQLKAADLVGYTVIEDPDNALRFLLDGFEFNAAAGGTVPGTAEPGPDKVDRSLVLFGVPYDASIDDRFTGVRDNATALAFGEFGLLPSFVNISDFLTNTSREAVTVALDAQGNMLWYSIDRGLGWNFFQNQVLSAQFTGTSLVLEVSEPVFDPLTGLPVFDPNTGLPTHAVYKREVALGASCKTLGVDPNGTGRVMKFTGTFAQLRDNFPPG